MSPAADPLIGIRAAERGDLGTLSELAWNARASWGYSAEDMEAWRERLTLRADDLRQWTVRVIALENRVVGFYALRPRPGRWRLEHLWVLPELQRKGFGRRLIEDALAQAKTAGVGLVSEADPHSASFFERIGARRAGVTTGIVARGPEGAVPIYEIG